MKKIEIVDSSVVRPLRHKVLRPGQPYSSTSLDKDNDNETKHFALFVEGSLMSVATIYPENIDGEYSVDAYRLRGMATDSHAQGAGYGTEVLKRCIDYLKDDTNAVYLWCNARESAFGFYEKFGFTIVGEIFDIKNIGPHKKGIYNIK